MLRSYFITAFRHFRRDKFFSILNLFGLTIGVTAFILLMLYVKHELSYDKFHQDGERIYVMAEKGHDVNGPINNERYLFGLSLKLQELVPDLAEMVHITFNGEGLIEIGNERFYEQKVHYTNQSFFDVFSFEILQGKPDFSKPLQAVISQRLAEKYFLGESPVGKPISINNREYQIAAVIENAPANTHIQYEVLLSNEELIAKGRKEYPNEYGGSVAVTAVKIPAGKSIEDLEVKVRKVIDEVFVESKRTKYENGEFVGGTYMVPFRDVHLKSLFNWNTFPVSDIRYVYLFSSIAVLIILIACFNYVNLATARSLKKMKEVGVRKVLGADRKQIVRQTIIESSLFAFFSVLIAFAIAERLLPAYNNLIDRHLELSYWSVEFLVFVFGLSILVGLVAGIYPALRMSNFKALKALTGRESVREKSGVRRGLVWFQFFIAQGLIVATMIIQAQLNYLQNKDLGYDREALLYIDAKAGVKDNSQAFKEEVLRISGVEQVSLTNGVLGRYSVSFKPMKDIEGHEDSEDYLIMDSFDVDTAFVSVMGMDFIQGGDFNSSDQIAPNQALIVNEAFIEKLGWEEAIGRKFSLWGEKYIVGVVKDFHNESLKATVKPAVLSLDENPFSFINIKINTQNTRETVQLIEAKWNEFVPEQPFQFHFYDDVYDAHYTSEIRLGMVFNIFSGIAITISILGLIGLTSFAVEQRLKEFGVRKVLGAKIKQLVFLLSKEFVMLILIAFVVAGPIAYFALTGWLEGFEYKVQIGAFTFVTALSVTLIIALLSMTYQFRKVSRVNPTEILRNE